MGSLPTPHMRRSDITLESAAQHDLRQQGIMISWPHAGYIFAFGISIVPKMAVRLALHLKCAGYSTSSYLAANYLPPSSCRNPGYRQTNAFHGHL